MILVQHIRLQWQKDCRGGFGAVARSRYPQAALLPKNYFDYIPFGIPVHELMLGQDLKGFHIRLDRREIKEFSPQKSLHLKPMEVIDNNRQIAVRYRYDWHGGVPERRRYDPATGHFTPINELAMELEEGDYGRAVCNGRFVGWETGWYELCILNIMILPGKSAPLDCFLANTPNKHYKQIAQLW